MLTIRWWSALAVVPLVVATALGQTASKEDDTDAARMARLREGIRKIQKDTPAGGAAERIQGTNKQLQDQFRLQQERDRRSASVLRDLDRTGLPPKDDIEFPKDWKAKTTARKGSNDVPLTAKEKAILHGLDKIVAVQFKNASLENVIENLRTQLGQPILVDKIALDATGHTYDTPITLQMKGVTLRTVLRRLLNDLGLAYVIREQTVQVVSAEQAKEMMVTRVHYVGDLIFGWWQGDRLFQAAQLIDLIQNTIDPQSWQVNGGSATIVYHDLTRSLVIKAPAEIHPVLSSGLR